MGRFRARAGQAHRCLAPAGAFQGAADSVRQAGLAGPAVLAASPEWAVAVASGSPWPPNERRCGGYFAFPTRAQAETFVQADRAKQAMAKSMLAGYTLDNHDTVNRWLPQVQEQRLYATIRHLSGYRNRYFASTHGRTSAEWIRDHWQSLAAGREDVTTELFTACANCGTQPSVILTIRGSDLPHEVVVLGAHLDSINGNTRNDPNQLAPGADDDASGALDRRGVRARAGGGHPARASGLARSVAAVSGEDGRQGRRVEPAASVVRARGG